MEYTTIVLGLASQMSKWPDIDHVSRLSALTDVELVPRLFAEL